MKKEAVLYEMTEGGLLHCFLCAHHCRIGEGKFGFCGVRQNSGGKLFTYAYADIIAAHEDPVEKKPLYHFFPGSKSFSIATIGCNFRCGFCQNWQISQQSFKDGRHSEGEELSPQEVVRQALADKCDSISYTYTEPTIFFEFAEDTARLAREKGLKNIFVTNGFMTKECLEEAKDFLDAANIDLKFFKDESYKRVCSARLKPVLDSIKLMKDLGIWVEVTTLIITGENDSDEELSAIAGFLASVDKDIPWHISRFHPDYKFTSYEATPEETLKRAQMLGLKAGLKYIYAGNVYGWGSDTVCSKCSKLLIAREGFSVLKYNIKKGCCAYCGNILPGRFKS